MNLRGIDLNLLPILEAIYLERSLTRASNSLHMTQPAVSNALARLRAHFEDPLFVREGRGMKPTAMSEALIPAVREALDRLRTGLEPKAAFDPSKSSRVFNISVRDTGAFLLAPKLAHTLELHAPHVRLQCHQVDRAKIPIDLASGRLDLAIDIAGLRGREVESETIATVPFVCVLAPDHPYASGRLTAARYFKLRHVTVSSRRDGQSMIEQVVRSLGHRLTPIMRLPSYVSAFEVVRATQFALAAPAAIAQSSGLLIRRLPFEAAQIQLATYRRKLDSADPALNWLKSVILEIAKPFR